MPQIFRIGSYWVYFWTNEGLPLEPIHIHIAEGKPVPSATKVWISKSGKCSLANNNSNIPSVVLNKLLRVIEARSFEIMTKWKNTFGEIDFYC